MLECFGTVFDKSTRIYHYFIVDGTKFGVLTTPIRYEGGLICRVTKLLNDVEWLAVNKLIERYVAIESTRLRDIRTGLDIIISDENNFLFTNLTPTREGVYTINYGNSNYLDRDTVNIPVHTPIISYNGYKHILQIYSMKLKYCVVST